MRRLACLMLLLLLPAASLAVQEGVVEDAPLVEVRVSVPPDTGISFPSPEMETRAESVIEQVYGHEDMQHVVTKKKWYIPAAFDASGLAHFEAKAREGVEVTLRSRAGTAKFSYEADVLFDLETGEVICAGMTYDFSAVEPAVPEGYRRTNSNGFGLRAGQMVADDHLGLWNKPVQMTLSPKSDEEYIVSHGMVDENWRFEFTMERETGNAVRYEFLRGE